MVGTVNKISKIKKRLPKSILESIDKNKKQRQQEIKDNKILNRRSPNGWPSFDLGAGERQWEIHE